MAGNFNQTHWQFPQQTQQRNQMVNNRAPMMRQPVQFRQQATNVNQPQQTQPPQQPNDPRVSFEPIDPVLLKKLQEEAAAEDAMMTGTKIEPVQPDSVTVNIKTPDFPEKISAFAQNERNGSIYYSHLAKKAFSSRHKEFLTEISANCTDYSKAHMALYKKHSMRDVEIIESAIDDTVSFSDGIHWAIEEESKALRTLTKLYDSSFDEITLKKLYTLICMKIGDLGILSTLN